jgi:GNAT superfamily N-acetyltransferase
MTLNYSFDRPIEPEQLQPLFRQTGWARNRNIEGIKKMLQATPIMIGAWDGDHLIGYARAITDGIYRALIDDVVVDESKRGQGVGSELMRRLIEHLDSIEEIFLRCGENVVLFYERHNFERSGAVVMDLKRAS